LTNHPRQIRLAVMMVRGWCWIAVAATLPSLGAACLSGSDDVLPAEVGTEEHDRADGGTDDAAPDDGGVEAEAEATCRELVDQLGAYTDEHSAGCTTADDCTALGQVFTEFPPPFCDCKWVLARPWDTWGYDVPFVVLDSAAASIQPLVDQIERECISWDRCIGARYCLTCCDVLHVVLRPSCDAGTCGGEIWMDPTICNEPGG